MNLKDMKKEELESLSFDDLAYYILKEKGKTTTTDLFKKICELQNLNERVYENQIEDFFTILTTEKRFVLINGKWDLKENHKIKAEIEEEEDLIEDMENHEEEEEEEKEEYINENKAIDDDDDEDDLKNLVVLDENELEEM